jgi:hypothetical protein
MDTNNPQIAQIEKTVSLLTQRDVILRQTIDKIKKNNQKQNQYILATLTNIHTQLTTLKWMLQIYENNALSEGDEHYGDFEKLSQMVFGIIDQVKNISTTISETDN